MSKNENINVSSGLLPSLDPELQYLKPLFPQSEPATSRAPV